MNKIKIAVIESKLSSISKLQDNINLLLEDCKEELDKEFVDNEYRFQFVGGDGLMVGDDEGTLYILDEFMQCLRVGADIGENCRTI